MEYANRARPGWLGGALALGLLVSLLGSSSVLAQPIETGTLIGMVTCGLGDETTTPSALVTVEGTDFSTHSDVTGRFTLVVPAMQVLTVNAMTGPEEAPPAMRGDISVQPGETLDIGHLDLVICPSPQAPGPTDIGPSDQQESVREQIDNSTN